MTHNGSGYVSTLHTRTCRELGLRHVRIQPYRPNERQGRAIHPDLAEGMGLRVSL
jgi:hypothetical protein